MSSILKNILRGPARPAVQRPVPMAQNPARSQAVETLELRVREALPLKPGPVEYETSPVQRVGLMAAGRVRQAEESKVAQLERELVMERLRTKELRAQLLEMDARVTALLEAGHSSLHEEYEGLDPDEVIPWVERVLMPMYGLALAKVKGGAL
jgi:hypothetical protein